MFAAGEAIRLACLSGRGRKLDRATK